MHGGDIYRNQIKIDFSVNINPLGIPKGVMEAMTEGLLEAVHYPDLEIRELKEALADRFEGIDAENVLCGNGASELLMALAHGLHPQSALLVAPGFSGYEHALSAVTCQIKRWYAKEEQGFAYTIQLCDVIKKEKPDMVIFANPSNPVGALMEKDLLHKVVEACEEVGAFLVIDECFLELSGRARTESMVSELKNHEKLMILRAFTKSFAIPGVRLGYLLTGNKELHQIIKKQLPEWNVSVIAQRAGIAALKEIDFLEKSIALIEKEREFLQEGLEKMGLKTFQSYGNYVLFQIKEEGAAKQNLEGKIGAGQIRTEQTEKNQSGLKEWLLKEGILIRDCSDYEGLKQGFYRIAVRERRDNELLFLKIEDYLREIRRR